MWRDHFSEFTFGFLIALVLSFGVERVALGFSQDDLEKLKGTTACPGCNLEKAPLKDLDLRGANLEGANLEMSAFLGSGPLYPQLETFGGGPRLVRD